MHSHIILVPTLSSKVASIKWSLWSWASAAEVCRETFFETKTEIFQDSKKISKRGFVSAIFGLIEDMASIRFFGGLVEGEDLADLFFKAIVNSFGV